MSEHPQNPGLGPEQAPQGQPVQQSGQQVDWEARFKGLSQVLNVKDEKIRVLEAQLAEKEKELASLRASLEGKEISLSAQLQQLKAELEKAISEKAGLESAQKEQQAELNRLQAIMEASRVDPEIVLISQQIPALPDPEAQKVVVENMLKGIQAIKEQTLQKAKQGLLPQIPRAKEEEFNYSTSEEWRKAAEKARGKPEYEKVMAAWRSWAYRSLQEGR